MYFLFNAGIQVTSDLPIAVFLAPYTTGNYASLTPDTTLVRPLADDGLEYFVATYNGSTNGDPDAWPA